jgi:hypothetical protein
MRTQPLSATTSARSNTNTPICAPDPLARLDVCLMAMIPQIRG